MSKSRLMTIVPCALVLFASSPSRALTLPACLDSVQFYGTSTVQLLDRDTVGAMIQSGGDMIIGHDSRVANLRVGGNLTLGDRSDVLWNSKVQGTISVGNQASAGTVVTGTVSPCSLPQVKVYATAGINDVSVGNGQTLTLQPGTYGTVTVQNAGQLVLAAGNYQMAELITQPDVTIRLQGETILLVGDSGIHLGDRTTYASAISNGAANVLVASSGSVTIGTDVNLIGTWVAPAADVTIQSRSTLTGAFVAHSLILDNGIPNVEYAKSSFIRNAISGSYVAAVNVMGQVGNAVSGYSQFPMVTDLGRCFPSGNVVDADGNIISIASASASVQLKSPIFHEYQIPISQRAGSGNYVNGVNTESGRYTYSVNMGAISATGGISYPLSLSYYSPTPTLFSKNSEYAPTGPVGFGWDFEFPYIVTDHKGTVNYSDDAFYANFGPWGGGQLVSADGATFHLNNNPYMKITPIGDTNQVDGWNVELSDGTVIVLGLREDAKRKTFVNGRKVGLEPGSSAYASDPTFTYRWDVTEIRAPENRGVIRFDWNKIGGKMPFFPDGAHSFDRESWLSQIWSVALPFSVTGDTSVCGNASCGIDSIRFHWSVKGNDEVVTKTGYVTEYQPSIIDTRYLDTVEYSSMGKQSVKWIMGYSVDKNANGDPKRFLRNIRYQFQSGKDEIGQWHFDYDIASASPSGWLTSAVDPSFVQKKYSFSNSAYGQHFMDTTKSESGFGTALKFVGDQSACVGQFCYVAEKVKMAADNSNALTLQAYLRAGNSYYKVRNDIFKQSALYYGNDFFVVVDSVAKSVTVYQWDGNAFISSNPFAGDSRIQSSTTDIDVAVGADFFVVSMINGSNGEVVPVVRDGQDWISVNRNISSCEADARTYSYSDGNDQNMISTSCFAAVQFGKSQGIGKILVAASNNTFIAMPQWSAGIAVFRRNPGSNTFTNETNHINSAACNNVWAAPTSSATAANLGGNPISLVAGDNWFAAVLLSWPNFDRVGSIAWSWNGAAWNSMLLTPADDQWGTKAWSGSDWRPDELFPASDGVVLVTPEGYVSRFKKNTNGISDVNSYPFVRTNFQDANGKAIAYDNYESAKHMPHIVTAEHFTAFNFTEPYAHGESKWRGDIPLSISVSGGSCGNANGKEATHLFFQNSALNVTTSGQMDGLSDLSSKVAGENGTTQLDVTAISSNEDWLIGKSFSCGVGGAYWIKYYYVPLINGNLSDGTIGVIPDAVSNWVTLDSMLIGGSDDFYGPELALGANAWLMVKSTSSALVTTFNSSYSSGPAIANYMQETLRLGATSTQSLYTTDRAVSSKYMFIYKPLRGNELFYNTSMTPSATSATVWHYSGNGIVDSEVDSSYSANVFMFVNPTIEQLDWIGELKSVQTFSNTDNTSVLTTPTYRTRKGESGWASAVTLVTSISTKTQLIYPGEAVQSHTTYQDQFNSVSGLPAIQADVMGGADNGEYRHHAIQRSINEKGVVSGVREAMLKDSTSILGVPYCRWGKFSDYCVLPGTKKRLLETPLGNTLIQQMMLDGRAVPVNAQEINYASNLRDVVATWNWGVAPINTDAVFDTGVQQRPTSFDAGWTQTFQITQRSTTGNVIEAVSMPGIYGQKWSTQLHEGTRGQVMASASGAARNEFAALTAEDGSAANNTEIYNPSSLRLTDGRWEMGSAAGFDSSISHTGKWSVRVENNYGPTANIALDSILAHKDGVRVGGWAYSQGSTAPEPLIQIWKQSCSGDDCITNSFLATTEGGYKPNVWQYWTTTIPYETLKASDPGAGGYARVFFGIYGTGTKVWVDDIFASPASASVSLQTHDGQGRPSASLSANGSVTTREYNGKGAVQAVRDERGRIFGQSTTIPAGEN